MKRHIKHFNNGYTKKQYQINLNFAYFATANTPAAWMHYQRVAACSQIEQCSVTRLHSWCASR